MAGSSSAIVKTMQPSSATAEHLNYIFLRAIHLFFLLEIYHLCYKICTNIQNHPSIRERERERARQNVHTTTIHLKLKSSHLAKALTFYFHFPLRGPQKNTTIHKSIKQIVVTIKSIHPHTRYSPQIQVQSKTHVVSNFPISILILFIKTLKF